MKFERVSRVLNTLSCVGSAVESIAVRADVEVLEAYAALEILRCRGLAEGRIASGEGSGARFFLPAGISEPQAQLLLWIGEHGPASAPELAVRLGRNAGEVRTDLFILRTAGRLVDVCGAWQLQASMTDATVRGIAQALEARKKILDPKK